MKSALEIYTLVKIKKSHQIAILILLHFQRCEKQMILLQLLSIEQN